MHMSRYFALSAALLMLQASVATACDRCRAGGHAMRCEVCGGECCPCEIEQHTIMVPMCLTETRMKVRIVKTTKEREETYTVFTSVPQKRTFTKECCYLEPEVKSKEITKTECHRVRNPVTLEDTVLVPVTEMHTEMQCREVCTICGTKRVAEECTCCVNHGIETPRVQNCTREDVVFEECKKTIDYCVITPKTEKKECGTETVCKLVPIEKTRKVLVCVPEAIKEPVEVKVTRMVAKNVCCCNDCWCELKEEAKDCKECKGCTLFNKHK